MILLMLKEQMGVKKIEDEKMKIVIRERY